MNQITIDSSEHVCYRLFERLYSISFPLFEQRTRSQQEAAFSRPNYHLRGYEENGFFAGFISYWEFNDYMYIEHFAIDPEIRGMGCGSGILRHFIRSTDKMSLLEIDPITDEVSEARLHFYRKCGFYENPYPHVHPPYRNGYDAHPLIVLTTDRTISEREYLVFNRDLANTVMDVMGGQPD